MMTSLIEYANFAGDRWAVWMLTNLLDSAVLLVLTSLVWLVVRQRVAPQVGYCLFLLVPLKLLMPVSITVPAVVAQWTPSALVSEWRDSDRVHNVHPAAGPLATSHADLAATPKTAMHATPSTSVAKVPDAPAEVDVPQATTSARSPASESQATSPPLSISAIAGIAWLGVVLLLLGRLVVTQLRLRARLRGSLPLDESRLALHLPDLCRRAGIVQPIRVVESDCVAAPAVWGISQPTIILPEGVVSALTAQQLRWVLLHELAHIQRRDLLVVVLQRLVAILHFINPAVWIANRVIHRLREYACDDLAVALSDGSAIESGEAFLQILRHANRRPRGLEGALGIFGLDSRASCFQRVSRLLDSARPIRTRSGPWALCGLILLAAIALPHLRAGSDDQQPDSPPVVKEPAKTEKPRPKADNSKPKADDSKPKSDTPQPKTDTDTALAKDTGEFELRIVGPDGQPIPEALVEVRVDPHPTAEQVRQGKFVRPSTYGPYVKADAEGRLRFALPQSPRRFELNITTPGYGPYWAGWTIEGQTQSIPARFTAELEAAWSVGGIIVDDSGKPIPDVRVAPNIKFKKRPGDQHALGMGSNIKTDADGKWRFDSVPGSKSQVFVEISHPAFKPLRRQLTRSEFDLKTDPDLLRKIVLERGLTVTGKVTDKKTGAPIAGALIRTKFLNDIREAKTDAGGVYQLIGCEPMEAKIVVSAPGRATDMQKLRIAPQMEAINFQMQPGGTVRIQVLDAQGKPVPKARIFFQDWRGDFDYFEFNHVSQYANENGVWEWLEAPLDEFKADICPPTSMGLSEQPLTSRQEPYVFRMPLPFVVSGKVVDAETKKPIQKFLVVPGIRSSADHMNWARGLQQSVTGGKYSFRETHDYFAYLLRIEAEGYLPAVSRDIKTNEGSVTIDFELKKGIDVAGKVLTPDGKPAAQAQVDLGVALSYITLRNGKLDNSTSSSQTETNAAGEFRFPPPGTEYQLVIVHPAGYAHFKGKPDLNPSTIKLEPWARVEGTFRIGKNPIPNVPITMNTAGLQSSGEASIWTHYDTTTGKDGHFAFERVIPGKARIGRRILLTVDDGAKDVTSSTMIVADFPGGETTQVDLGGSGQQVVGKLRPPAGYTGQVHWNFAQIHLGTSQPAEDSPQIMATVDRDGTFHIDDLAAGTYQMAVRFDRDPPGTLQNHSFTVPPIKGETSEKPVDLGVITLEK